MTPLLVKCKLRCIKSCKVVHMILDAKKAQQAILAELTKNRIIDIVSNLSNEGGQRWNGHLLPLQKAVVSLV